MCISLRGLGGAEEDVEVSAESRGGFRGAVDAGDVALRVDPAKMYVFRVEGRGEDVERDTDVARVRPEDAAMHHLDRDLFLFLFF